MKSYLILSYAAAKSASGIGTAIVSLFMLWNDSFICLPDFSAASSRPGAAWWRSSRVFAGLDLRSILAVIDLQLGADRQVQPSGSCTSKTGTWVSLGTRMLTSTTNCRFC